MWFDPAQLTKTQSHPLATLATSATFKTGGWAEVAEVAKVATPTESKTAPLTAGDEKAVRTWLAHIGEADQEIIGDVLGQCQHDAGARDYFTGRAAAELPKPEPFPARRGYAR